MKNKKVIVFHRTTNENLKKIQEEMIIRAHVPRWKCLDGKDKVVWVSLGKPNWRNRLMSGMIGKRGEAYVMFEIEENKLKKPFIVKRIFSWPILARAQYVIHGDVELSENAAFVYKEEEGENNKEENQDQAKGDKKELT